MIPGLQKSVLAVTAKTEKHKKDPVQVQGGIFGGKLHGPGPGMGAAIYLDSVSPERDNDLCLVRFRRDGIMDFIRISDMKEAKI